MFRSSFHALWLCLALALASAPGPRRRVDSYEAWGKMASISKRRQKAANSRRQLP